jgi:hypothetical protein
MDAGGPVIVLSATDATGVAPRARWGDCPRHAITQRARVLRGVKQRVERNIGRSRERGGREKRGEREKGNGE